MHDHTDIKQCTPLPLNIKYYCFTKYAPLMMYCLFYNQYYYLWLYDLSHVSFGGYLVAGLYRKFLQLDNSSFCYYERPAPIPDQHKATTVLLLHGFTANKTMWMVVSKFLPKDWRIVVLDLPGHGESSFTHDGNYSAFGLAQKLHEVSPPPPPPNTHTHTHTYYALVETEC